MTPRSNAVGHMVAGVAFTTLALWWSPLWLVPAAVNWMLACLFWDADPRIDDEIARREHAHYITVHDERNSHHVIADLRANEIARTHYPWVYKLWRYGAFALPAATFMGVLLGARLARPKRKGD